MIILENNKNNAINYTIAYEIEAKRDNKWYKLGIINDFIEEIYEVDAKSTDQIIIDWKNSYSKLLFKLNSLFDIWYKFFNL